MSDQKTAQVAEPFKPRPSTKTIIEKLEKFAKRYQPFNYKEDIVLEFYFTDLSECYQFILKEKGCELRFQKFIEYTTKIEINYEIFQDIAFKGLCIKEVILNKDCKIMGSFDTIIYFEDYFNLTKKELVKKATLSLMIVQWMMIWMVMSFDVFWGSVAGIVYSSMMPLLSRKFKLTFYDRLSIFLVTSLCLLGLVAVNETIIVCLSYFLFGAMWLGSCIAKVPLTTFYNIGKFGYLGYYNDLFLKTNRILTAMWGFYYLIVTVTTYFLSVNGFRSISGILNLIIPILLAIFTKKFAKWYPAKMAQEARQLASQTQES